MSGEDKLQKAANRIQRGEGTEEDVRLIEREFQRAKNERIRMLGRRERSKLWK